MNIVAPIVFFVKAVKKNAKVHFNIYTNPSPLSSPFEGEDEGEGLQLIISDKWSKLAGAVGHDEIETEAAGAPRRSGVVHGPGC